MKKLMLTGLGQAWWDIPLDSVVYIRYQATHALDAYPWSTGDLHIVFTGAVRIVLRPVGVDPIGGGLVGVHIKDADAPGGPW